MKEMIKKYRGSLICSVLVMLIGSFSRIHEYTEHVGKCVFCSDGLCAGGNNIL